ncbi:MAG TPA: hypothetical protein VHG08_10430 [Longimicrobium sp.]|nr:hypothetical protein [Longimicrobium sp.]
MTESSSPTSAATADCTVCGELPAFVAADLRAGERLPEAASRLVDLHPVPEGFWDTAKEYEITKKCPVCGRLYTYNYHYDFSVGYVEESVWLERRAAADPPGSSR